MLSACRIDGECLGWLPAACYDARHPEGRIHVCYNNDDIVGYCLWFNEGTELRIYHTWVRRDARLLVHGRALVDAVEREGAKRHATRISLWCATDLAANLFWRALQFERGVWRWGRAKRARKHWSWTRPIRPCYPSQQQVATEPAIALATSNRKAIHPPPAMATGTTQLPQTRASAASRWHQEARHHIS